MLSMHVRFGVEPVLYRVAIVRAVLLVDRKCYSGNFVMCLCAARTALFLVLMLRCGCLTHAGHACHGQTALLWGDYPCALQYDVGCRDRTTSSGHRPRFTEVLHVLPRASR